MMRFRKKFLISNTIKKGNASESYVIDMKGIMMKPTLLMTQNMSLC